MEPQHFSEGTLWVAKQLNGLYLVSLKDKASIVEALKDFVTEKKIGAGKISGIGAVKEAILRFFNPATKDYVDKAFNEQMEIANLTGNISTQDGKPYLHLHVTLGNAKYKAYAGHLLDGYIRGAGEFYIEPVNAIVERKFSEEIGLNIYDLKKE